MIARLHELPSGAIVVELVTVTRGPRGPLVEHHATLGRVDHLAPLERVELVHRLEYALEGLRPARWRKEWAERPAPKPADDPEALELQGYGLAQ